MDPFFLSRDCNALTNMDPETDVCRGLVLGLGRLGCGVLGLCFSSTVAVQTVQGTILPPSLEFYAGG